MVHSVTPVELHCMLDASLQVEATRAEKMLGTFAMSFENITQHDGVLVQGKTAQEGEATSSCPDPCDQRHLPSALTHLIGLSQKRIRSWYIKQQRARPSIASIAHVA